jgi:peptidyl-tRNA hydrolase, PTH2 family
MAEVKQVIVMRKDLKMRRGKEIAQGAHASMAFLAKKSLAREPFSDVERAWLEGLFTKVCLRVESEEALLAVARAAEKEGIQVEIITDAGKTEFGGVPTRTCLALGPDLASKIDSVTGGLELY